jgi:hypothetical protein
MAAAVPDILLGWEGRMAARLIPGMSKLVDVSGLSFIEIGAQRRRRAAVDFITGSVLFVTSAAAMISDGASAQGPGGGLFSGMFASSPASYESYAPSESRPTWQYPQTSSFNPGRQFGGPPPGFADFPVGPPIKASKRNKARSAKAGNNRKPALHSVGANYSSHRPVCVRLCDGFFFPASVPAGASNAATEEAACAGLCPDAPTALFYQPSGSDKIEDAISATGHPYSALPIALRYRSAHDDTCTCHRSLVSALSPLHDSTLRKGDALMTPKGFMVFRGVEQATHTPRDFAALAAATLPKDQRATLQALERVSQAPQPGVTRSWLAAATAAPAATETATREITDKIRFVERPD